MDINTGKRSNPIDPHNTKPESGNVQPKTSNPQPGTRNPLHAMRSAPSPMPLPRNPHSVYALDLGLIDYPAAWALQQKLVAARVENHIDHDILIFLEHPAVFTLGRRGGLDNLLVSESFLKDSGIPVIQVERGGVITYHGPGQIVVYPIMNLHTRRIGVQDFVAAMEEAMLQTAADWNIAASRNPINSGIWVGNQKMGSIGIALRKGVSFHGLALNVNLDLTPFSWIQPCGLQGVSMTSMERESGEKLPMKKVLNVLKDQLSAALGIFLENCDLSDLEGQLKL
jgi:lipoate-protein ligase B